MFHLPVRGTGDGGIYTTVADVRGVDGVFAGRVVPADWVAEMVRPRSVISDGALRAGVLARRLGRAVRLEGFDAGVSFRSWHPPAAVTDPHGVSNTFDGAWPLARASSKARLSS